MAITKPRFAISCNNANTTLQHIHNITNNCAGINIEYIGKIYEIINKRCHTWVGSIESPADSALIKQIIGKNGFHLKQFTRKYGVELIWHDRDSNMFLVWGNKPCLISALYALQRQVSRFIEKQAKLLSALENISLSMDSIQMAETVETVETSRRREDIEGDDADHPSKRMKYAL